MAIRFLLKNLADLATITSSDFAASLPVTNLQVEGRGRVARTSNATGTKTINGDLAEASTLSCAVLYRHNLRYNGTWRLYLYSGAGQTGTTLYDSTATNAYSSGLFTGWGYGFSTLYFTAVASVLSFRIELADASHPDGYLEAKRLMLGAYFEPGVNVEYGLRAYWDETSTQRRTFGGSIRTDDRVAYRRFMGALPRITDAERITLADGIRHCGRREEVFVSAFPGVGAEKERDHALLGKFTRLPDIMHGEYSSHRAAFEIEEA